MRKQEQTRLTELAAEKAHYEAIQSQADIVSDKLNPCMVSIGLLSVYNSIPFITITTEQCSLYKYDFNLYYYHQFGRTGSRSWLKSNGI